MNGTGPTAPPPPHVQTSAARDLRIFRTEGGLLIWGLDRPLIVSPPMFPNGCSIEVALEMMERGVHALRTAVPHYELRRKEIDEYERSKREEAEKARGPSS